MCAEILKTKKVFLVIFFCSYAIVACQLKSEEKTTTLDCGFAYCGVIPKEKNSDADTERLMPFVLGETKKDCEEGLKQMLSNLSNADYYTKQKLSKLIYCAKNISGGETFQETFQEAFQEAYSAAVERDKEKENEISKQHTQTLINAQERTAASADAASGNNLLSDYSNAVKKAKEAKDLLESRQGRDSLVEQGADPNKLLQNADKNNEKQKQSSQANAAPAKTKTQPSYPGVTILPKKKEDYISANQNGMTITSCVKSGKTCCYGAGCERQGLKIAAPSKCCD
ncbi:MAG: hypothetical protein LBG46_05040 [Elusimicrobiota bacterium]|jgi:hypothetical protein|nr:hypothetical protein [Elusimicrobiota bacterium]